MYINETKQQMQIIIQGMYNCNKVHHMYTRDGMKMNNFLKSLYYLHVARFSLFPPISSLLNS